MSCLTYDSYRLVYLKSKEPKGNIFENNGTVNSSTKHRLLMQSWLLDRFRILRLRASAAGLVNGKRRGNLE